MEKREKNADRPEFRVRKYLLRLIENGSPGDRLPRVRDLMTKFHTSQRVVERAARPLIAKGRITARRGAGLHVGAGRISGPEFDADCLILYRTSESRLARNLLVELVKRLRRSGLRVSMIGFSTEKQALEKMAGRGSFRCCVLQVNFEILTINFLARIREMTDALIIDGVSVTGIDADVIGTNWREALSTAFRELARRGHRRIGFLTSSHDARQIAMARREFDLLVNWKEPEPNPLLFQVPRLPGSYKHEDLLAVLSERNSDDTRYFSALIVWGLVDGYLLESALAESRLLPGVDISMVLLGSVDVASEHVARFDTFGNSNSEKLDLFENIVRSRIAGTGKAPTTHYLPIHFQEYGSTQILENL